MISTADESSDCEQRRSCQRSSAEFCRCKKDESYEYMRGYFHTKSHILSHEMAPGLLD